MSHPQKTYRVYCFDGEQMTITGDLIKAGSDEEATAKVEAMGFGTKCEIWQGKRLVAQFEAERRTG